MIGVEDMEIIREYAGNNPLYLSESFRTELMAIHQEDALSKIIQDSRNILFAAIKGMDEILFCGRLIEIVNDYFAGLLAF